VSGFLLELPNETVYNWSCIRIN